MNRRKFDAARNYMKVSGNLATHGNGNQAWILLRLLASRFFYGMGPDVFDRRRFLNKKLKQTREYLTLRERENLQKSLCPVDARGMVENKLRFYEKCLSHGIPTPSVFGVFLLQETAVPDGIPIFRSRQELRNFMDHLPDGRYVVKPVDGGHGWGISAFDIRYGRIADLAGLGIDFDRIHRHVTDDRYDSPGYLFQEFVFPHPALRPVMPGPGLGTFRIVTFLMGGRSVDIPFAVVKIPVGGNVTDNFDAGYSGNWVCPVDVETGRIGNAVGKTPSVPVFSEIEKRHDTGATFRCVQVPLWEEVKSTVRRSALVFSGLRTIGWDVAVTVSGACILEANWDWGENIIEVAHNRGLRTELSELTRKSLLADAEINPVL
jgi:hypothetical protein